MLYRNTIQKTIATSKFTLPVVVVISAIFWFLSFKYGANQPITTDWGLWRHIPLGMENGWESFVTGFIFSLLAVYLMAEFNNKFVLLRISSRMLSSTLATLLTMCAFMHSFQPAHIILVLFIIAYFPLFFSYQRSNSMPLAFVAFTTISAASLFFPKLLLTIPVFWIAQIILRAFTIRTFTASLLGLVVPYWLILGTAYLNNTFESEYSHFISVFHFTTPDLSILSTHQWMSIAVVALMGLMGCLHFYRQSYLDKTRTRTFMNVTVIMFIASLALLILEPAHFNEVFAIATINSSILTGHHLASEHTKFSNIYTIILCTLIACVSYANLIAL